MCQYLTLLSFSDYTITWNSFTAHCFQLYFRQSVYSLPVSYCTNQLHCTLLTQIIYYNCRHAPSTQCFMYCRHNRASAGWHLGMDMQSPFFFFIRLWPNKIPNVLKLISIKYWTGYELILKPVKPSQHQVKTIFCSHLIHINIYTGRKYLSSKTDCVRKHNYCTWSANSASKTCRNRRVWITTGKYI